MSNRFVVCSDVHIGVYNNFGKPVKGENLNDVSLASINAFQQVLDYASKHDSNIVVDGDLFDHRGTLDVRIINRVTKMISDFIFNTGRDIYILAGNHDQIDNSPKPENSLSYLEYLNDEDYESGTITIIDEPSYIDMGDYLGFYFIPYSEDVAMLKKAIEDDVKGLDPRKKNFLFAHVGVEGATDGGLYTHRLGGAFATGDLHYGDFDYVLLGHYHNRQNLGTKGNMWYVGSTSQKSFSDEGQDKGFDYFEVDNRGKVNHEFIKTKGKKYVTIDMKNTKYTAEEIQKLMQDNYVRVITYNKEQAKEIQKSASDSNVNIAVSLKEEQTNKNRLGIKADSSESQIVSAYTDKFYPDNPKINERALDELRKAQENAE